MVAALAVVRWTSAALAHLVFEAMALVGDTGHWVEMAVVENQEFAEVAFLVEHGGYSEAFVVAAGCPESVGFLESVAAAAVSVECVAELPREAVQP